MIRIGQTSSVELLQVRREIVNPLSIEELLSAQSCTLEPYFSDDIRRLRETQCLDKLRHRTFKISLAVQVISIQHVDLCYASVGHPLRLRQSKSKRVEVALVQHIQLCGCRMFLQLRKLLSAIDSKATLPGRCPQR